MLIGPIGRCWCWRIVGCTRAGCMRPSEPQGWHPSLRVNAGGTFRPAAGGALRPLGNAVREVGERWCGGVVCFQEPGRRLACTSVACWETGHQDRWLVLTDLPPQQAEARLVQLESVDRSWLQGW